MKTYKQRANGILEKVEKKKAIRRKIGLTAAVSCICAAFVGLGCVFFVPYNTEAPSVKKYENDEYYSVIKQINTVTYTPPVYKNNFEKWTAETVNFWDNFSFGCAAAGGDMMGAPIANESSNGNYAETTDNQTAGVIEGDLIKRTDKYIFYLSPCRNYSNGLNGHLLQIFSIQGEGSGLVGSYLVKRANNMYFYNDVEMYLSEDGTRVTLVGSCQESTKNKVGNRYTMITELDVSDVSNVREVGRKYLSGAYVSSRKADGSLFVVNNFSVPKNFDFSVKESYLPQYGSWENMQCVAAEDIVCPETATSASYTVICELDGLTVKDCTALLSYSGDVYASAENLFVYRSYQKTERDGFYVKGTDVTEISCLYYGGEGLEYKGSFTVDGEVKNQYAMDEYEGVLRVVTTTESSSYSIYAQNDVFTSKNVSLYCVRLSDFATVGKKENFAPAGESAESVRFDGVKAYVCTALIVTMTDPVYALDLTDPSNIGEVNTGVIEGYSTSLVDFKDGYLLGIGYNGLRELKIEIYEETETEMKSVCTYELDAEFSEDYKSYFIDRENGLIGLGVYCYNRIGNNIYGENYLLLTFDGYTLEEVLLTPLAGNYAYQRAVLVDGYLYLLGSDFKVVKIYG